MEATVLPTFPSNDSYITGDVEKDGQNEANNLWRRMTIVSMVIYSLAFLLGIIGNGLVIIITGFCMKKTVNTVLFLNLAIADFIFTFFLPLSIAQAALKFHWPFGRAMCKINNALAYLNLYASVYLLMVISMDRCISVRCPVWAQNHRTPQRAGFVALGVWTLALVLCSPNLHFRDTMPHPGKKGMIVCFNNYGHPAVNLLRHHAVVISRFIFGFVIPFSVIVACYGAIALRLRRDHLAQSSKPFKVITAVITAFFICWFPYHVFSFLELKYSGHAEMRLLLAVGIPLTSSLAFINSCLNPILYVFMGHDFKEKLRRSLLSVFEDAFAEESGHSTAQTKTRSSIELESHDK
ncbi:chemokine-like receptor 1 [Varanus komodoensis]|uniref:chemokine-like receptor 1 n=1 Tax=Varanus komodoensis TaxID=61221 RepID=UPI001CF79925|nr:chemokine-like receptor 1 [Varanus komodoensis]XP_044274765.1 chemokine-like receptor 1 [Varanus komodoensis]XP_044274766.1 chemokine-like receptor 1 [Varanus komodoensis]